MGAAYYFFCQISPTPSIMVTIMKHFETTEICHIGMNAVQA